MNFIDVLVASVFLVLAVLMLAHRVFWPLMNRPLYAERGARRKLLAVVGIALLIYAGLDVPELVKRAFEAIAG